LHNEQIKGVVVMAIRNSSFVPSRRHFLLNVFPAGTVFCLGCRNSDPPKTTMGPPEIEDERIKALWTKGVQIMEKGYT
jgi:hypothetical protein